MLYLLRVTLFVFTIAFIVSCNNPAKREDAVIADSAVVRGKALAAIYCQSCHMLPDPSLLDKKSWQTGVFPFMGPRMGIFAMNSDFTLPKNDEVDPGIFPDKPMLKISEWKNIISYYMANAPDTLPAQPKHETIKTGLNLFEVLAPKFSSADPSTCFVKIDTTVMPTQLLVGSAKNKMYRFNKQLALMDSISTPGPVVNMSSFNYQKLYCGIGNIVPNNKKLGNAWYYAGGKTAILFDTLARPTQILSADLNADKKTDYLICEFGYYKGALSWIENKGNGNFERHILMSGPGALDAYIGDANNDGLPDIWAMFAQGEEGIYLFTNKGDGNFNKAQLLRFPPSYGSSSFELDDFNKDGHPDILYTCGDNADYTPVLKPYHGLYLFLNDGTNHFKQTYFYPIHGCYKAMAMDFDGDGDLDIASIAYFADYEHQPEEGFIYFENKGSYNFSPSTFAEAKNGRWITMDVNDLDGDGKADIVLANFSSALGRGSVENTWKESPAFIVLKNNKK